MSSGIWRRRKDVRHDEIVALNQEGYDAAKAGRHVQTCPYKDMDRMHWSNGYHDYRPEPAAVPEPDDLRQALGEALTTALAALSLEGFDAYDSREIDPILDAIMPAIEPDRAPVLEDERVRFEKRVFNRRFIASIRKAGTGCMTFQAVACPTKADFVKRGEDGRYEDQTLDAMWWAWQTAMSMEPL